MKKIPLVLSIREGGAFILNWAWIYYIYTVTSITGFKYPNYSHFLQKPEAQYAFVIFNGCSIEGLKSFLSDKQVLTLGHNVTRDFKSMIHAKNRKKRKKKLLFLSQN